MRTSPKAAATVTLVAVVALLSLAPTPSLARPKGWGGSGQIGAAGPGWRDPRRDSRRFASRSDPREGRVEVSRFIIKDAAADLLGHGPVAVTSRADTSGDRSVASGTSASGTSDGASDYLAQAARAPFEAAVVDRLVSVGYDTLHTDPAGGQLAELRVSREVLVPAEIKRSPFSGTAAMEVGNRGSAYGLAVNVDMTKPRAALLSTRLQARITERSSGKVLWEGHAQIVTREGDERWNDTAIANRLAEALFDDFRIPTFG